MDLEKLIKIRMFTIEEKEREKKEGAGVEEREMLDWKSKKGILKGK